MKQKYKCLHIHIIFIILVNGRQNFGDTLEDAFIEYDLNVNNHQIDSNLIANEEILRNYISQQQPIYYHQIYPTYTPNPTYRQIPDFKERFDYRKPQQTNINNNYIGNYEKTIKVRKIKDQKRCALVVLSSSYN